MDFRNKTILSRSSGFRIITSYRLRLGFLGFFVPLFQSVHVCFQHVCTCLKNANCITLISSTIFTYFLGYFYIFFTYLRRLEIHWVPHTLSNLIHKNVLVIRGTRCILNIDANQKYSFLRKVCNRYSRVLVLTKLIVSETQ